MSRGVTEDSWGDGTYVYVTNFGSDTMSMIDTRINIVVATVFVGDGPSDVEVSAGGTRCMSRTSAATPYRWSPLDQSQSV